MTAKRQSVVLCEGYHDRAFWSGWLEYLKCESLWSQASRKVVDPWSQTVGEGHYAFRSPSEEFIRIVPCEGDLSKIRRKARFYLENAKTKEIRRLVINWDPDTDAKADHSSPLDEVQAIGSLVQEFDPAATRTPESDFALAIAGAPLSVSVVRWQVSDPAGTAGVPDQQTLERLVCAALSAAYPACGKSISDWLKSLPAGPEGEAEKKHKSHAWSYMAGWYADHGCEDFYRHVWRDAKVVSELRKRLELSGAWRIAAAVAQ